jgi:hypothetical protein
MATGSRRVSVSSAASSSRLAGRSTRTKAHAVTLFSRSTFRRPLFVAFELVEEGKTYREAMIPAARLNDYRATLSLALSEEEIVAVFCEHCSG